MALISIVSPVYNEADGIDAFCRELLKVFDKSNYTVEIILCLDPSTDGTEEVIKAIHIKDPRVKMIRFARRVGQDKATQAGIDFATGDAVIVMDCDLQDPVETIPVFLSEWEKGYYVVYATRISREEENPVKRFSANLFYRVLNRFSDVEIPRNTGDFRLMDQVVIKELRKYREDSFFLRALTPVIGFETKKVEISRQARKVGTTKYNRYFGGIKAAMVAIYGYTNVIQKIFLLISLLSLFFLVSVILFLLSYEISFRVTSSTLFLSLIICTLSLSAIVSFMGWTVSSYLDRIYKQGRNRPNYTISYTIGIEN